VSIVTGTRNTGQGNKVGTATVTLVYNNGSPVAAGYTVTGDFSGDIIQGDRMATTGSDGTATVESTDKARGGVTVSFCISDVSGGPLPYDPGANPEAVCDSTTTTTTAAPTTTTTTTTAAPTTTTTTTATTTTTTLPADSVHVASVVIGTRNTGQGNKVGTTTVTLVYSNGSPAGVGYTVTGDFSGDIVQPGMVSMETTGSDGIAVVESTDTARGGVTVSFCISGVRGLLGYVPGDNAGGTICGT